MFKNKWLWIIVFALTITGAIFGYIDGESQDKRIENAVIVKLQDYYNPDRPIVNGIKDTNLVEQYIKFEKDTIYPKALNFDSPTIPTDQTLYALEWTSDSVLVLIGRQNLNPTLADPRWMELWVWEKHLKKND